MNQAKNIGAFNHPLHGEYFIWHNAETNKYALTRATKAAPHCAYATLDALFKSKGI
jgi:hypothetical protein